MPRSLLAGCVVLAAAFATGADAGDSRLAGTLPGKADTGRVIALEADVRCTPAQAFDLWATEAGVKRFFAPSAQIGPVGGDYRIAFFPDEDPRGLTHGTDGAHVLAAEPGRFFAFEWVTFAGDRQKGDNAPPFAPATMRRPDPLPTWVEMRFSPSGPGTRISFHHFGFGSGALWDSSRTWFTGQWTGVLKAMAAYCEKGGGS